MKHLIPALILLGLCCSPVEARQRHASVLDPMCNITMPCELPYASGPRAVREARGRYVARQMGIGASRVVVKHQRAESFGAPISPVVSFSSGIVRSISGATARVAASATSAFQCVVSALDRAGYPVKFMGGLSSGHMRHSLHHIGMALDVNQYSRNVTRPVMPSNEIAIANSCGLVSGRQWSGNPDSGHFQKN